MSVADTIREHVEVVVKYCGKWPDDPPTLGLMEEGGVLRPDYEGYADALAAWSYVSGWANALNKTARELLDELEIEVPEKEE